jgi:hypothetical protein
VRGGLRITASALKQDADIADSKTIPLIFKQIKRNKILTPARNPRPIVNYP